MIEETTKLNSEQAVCEENGMNLHLENFDGPLDLLLHLIKNAKIDIKDVFVSVVTDQFLMYIKQAQQQDIELATEYLVVATTILEIKSRELLPKYEEEEAESEEENLIFQLEEYKLFKELSEILKTKQEVDVFYREVEEEISPNFVFEESTVEILVSAFQKVLINYREAIPGGGIEQRQLSKETLTVAMMIEEISSLLLEGTLSFFSLFTEQPSKERIVVTFMAILEMVKLGKIEITQAGNFQDIIIKSA
ncbi:MAG: segregation/condensation protein A [Bacillota bacterium]